MSPVRLLLVSAALQILVSSGVGAFLVVGLQPWGQGLMRALPSPRDVVKGHVDWMMLAALQLGAAFGCAQSWRPTRRSGRWGCWSSARG